MKKLLILMLIITFAGAAQGAYFVDDFDHLMDADWNTIDYQGWYMNLIAPGTYPGDGAQVIGAWDGYQSLPDPISGISPTIYASNWVDCFNGNMDQMWSEDVPHAWNPGSPENTLNGVLRMTNSGGGWEYSANSGPFLYKEITGNFQADVEVVGFDYLWHNAGGLMARQANPGDLGATENWVALWFFPMYAQGNVAKSTTTGGNTLTRGATGYNADGSTNPFLRLVREGTAFKFYTSLDGVIYNPLTVPDAIDPNIMVPLVIDRPDLSAELQVGIFGANFTNDWVGTYEFDNFVLVPEPATIALLGLGGLALIRRKR